MGFWLLVGLSRYERSESGNDPESSSVGIHPLPLVKHAGALVTASVSPGAYPKTDSVLPSCEVCKDEEEDEDEDGND